MLQLLKENRHTQELEHWSIAMKDGKALEKWRSEIPIPRGGPHRLIFTALMNAVAANPNSRDVENQTDNESMR
ncbi:hypothetical protein Bca52824_065696 [Brassica carinata]|uniref:Uncharacterized protein n=1 Tax=Brassica carinata TaxID=52824 RepID=A0A8X7UBA8_BRACI|nr:hypothetical protein Bca52824_065696 [Brassica carinata]